LLGRLLYESDGIYEDQLLSVKNASSRRDVELDLSLVTDGLNAEREQGITIDVAYRYFGTPRRKFIIADTPGHEQYTRNMATGASKAELALILVDARKGVLKQTRRHALIAWLFGIRQMIVAVNKMDLVDYDHEAFFRICEDFNEAGWLTRGTQVDFIPVSALTGANVVRCSERMAWYMGPALLEMLETVPVEGQWHEALRFPVQAVIRPSQDFRGYSGQVVSGAVEPEQSVVALPSLQRTTIKDVVMHKRMLERAFPPLSVVVSVNDHIDLGRGDMLVDADRMPARSKQFNAYLIWASKREMSVNARYLLKHTTQLLCARIRGMKYKIDIDTFETTDADELRFNEIGMVEIETHSAIFCDSYEVDRATGSFILIDALNNDTVAAGMIVEAVPAESEGKLEDSSEQFRTTANHGLTVWFTGLSGAGKTTICRAVQTELLARGLSVEVLDGDVVRKNLSKGLGFSKEDRDENIRRIAFVSHLLTRNGTIVLVSAISPYRAAREEARRTIGDFMEVHVCAPLPVCEVRDPKELYKKARSGKISRFTGIDDPYENPEAPEVVCNTELESVQESSRKVVGSVLNYLSNK
jgi:bifunctional enzyme CysN/CysC